MGGPTGATDGYLGSHLLRPTDKEMITIQEIERDLPSMERAGPGFAAWAKVVRLLIRAVREWKEYVLKGHVFNQSPESYLSDEVLALTEE